jgi:hypothetical protein
LETTPPHRSNNGGMSNSMLGGMHKTYFIILVLQDMLHKPIAIMILSIFVAGFLIPGILAADANAQGDTNTGSMSADWANSILAVHNSERAAVGVPSLVWSNSLAAGAQAWAEHLATIGKLVHASDAEKECYCVENLAGFNWEEGPTAPGGEHLYGSPKSRIGTAAY